MRIPRKLKKKLKKRMIMFILQSNAFNCTSFTKDIQNWNPQKGIDWNKMFENLGKTKPKQR